MRPGFRAAAERAWQKARATGAAGVVADLRVALTEGHTENDVMLRPFDIVYVPKKTISTLNLFVEQYIEELVPFENQMGVNAQYYMNEQQIDTKSRSVNFNTGATGVLDVLNP